MPTSGPAPPLGERRRARVVLDPRRQPEALPRPGDEIDVVEREIHRAQDPAGPALEVGRDPVADRRNALVEQSLDRVVERCEDAFLRPVGARNLVLRDDLPVPIDEPREDLRASHVEPDDDGSLHGGGYHNGPHGRGTEALPAVSRRSQEGQGPTRAGEAPHDAVSESGPAGRSVDVAGDCGSRSASSGSCS